MKRITGKKLLCLTTVLWILATLALVNVPVQSSPMVTISALHYYPSGYIPGVAPGSMVFVDLYIQTDIADGPQGIVQWAIQVKVSPNVLEPMGVMGASSGYFLYDYLERSGLIWMGYSTGPVLFKVDKAAGTIEMITEGISPDPPTGAGGSGKLVRLVFKSLSLDAYSSIDLYYEEGIDAYYWTPGGVFHVVDKVEDGHYNPPPVPEFPLGSVAPIALIAAVAYIWWVTKRKTQGVT